MFNFPRINGCLIVNSVSAVVFRTSLLNSYYYFKKKIRICLSKFQSDWHLGMLNKSIIKLFFYCWLSFSSFSMNEYFFAFVKIIIIIIHRKIIVILQLAKTRKFKLITNLFWSIIIIPLKKRKLNNPLVIAVIFPLFSKI